MLTRNGAATNGPLAGLAKRMTYRRECRLSRGRIREHVVWRWLTYLPIFLYFPWSYIGDLMQDRQRAVDERIKSECIQFKSTHDSGQISTVHYWKGYPYWLALTHSALWTAIIVLAIAIPLVRGSRTPRWARIFLPIMAAIGVLIYPIVNEQTIYYHEWPGGDVTSTMGHPCGFG